MQTIYHPIRPSALLLTAPAADKCLPFLSRSPELPANVDLSLCLPTCSWSDLWSSWASLPGLARRCLLPSVWRRVSSLSHPTLLPLWLYLKASATRSLFLPTGLVVSRVDTDSRANVCKVKVIRDALICCCPWLLVLCAGVPPTGFRRLPEETYTVSGGV